MRQIISALCVCFSLHSFAQTNDCTITGHVQGLQAGTWIYVANSSHDIDSVQATAGEFKMKIPFNKGEGSAFIIKVGAHNMGNNFKVVYLDKGHVEITGEAMNFRNARISGSAFATQQQAFQDTLQNEYVRQRIDTLYERYIAALKAHDSLPMLHFRTKIYAFDSARLKMVEHWISTHPSSPISTFALFTEMRDKLNLTEQEAILNKLSASAKDNVLAREIHRSIELDRTVKPGTMALNFTQPDVDGHPVALKDFRGKYVLVDFWASWCGPCRAENPNVLHVYNKFKDKNFTILGVSLDKQKAKWIEAIEKDQLPWTQVSDLKYWDNAVAKMYDVRAIPTNILIDPQGKIVAKNLHQEALERKLAEILK